MRQFGGGLIGFLQELHQQFARPIGLPDGIIRQDKFADFLAVEGARHSDGRLAETGWLVVKTAAAKVDDNGNHGYDPMAPEMAALFIANGPAIKPAGTLPGFDNVDIAPLLRDLIGLPPGQGLDGDDAPFRAVLMK